MPPEAAERREIGSVHQERRQEEDQREFGVERHRRQHRHERQEPAPDQQCRGRRQPHPERGPVEGNDDAEQCKDEFERFGGVHAPPNHAAAPAATDHGVSCQSSARPRGRARTVSPLGGGS